MKTLNCRDAGFDCTAEFRAETEEDILSQAAEHARADHNLEVTPEMTDQIRGLIKDEE